jgi:imidazolonepropionase-like amidohydrolase
MKRLITAVIAAFAAEAVLASTTAIINVNVLPMTDETIVPGQTVVVQDGRIAAIGDVDTLPVPEGATVVDGTDRFLMPGLAEMHAHVPGTGTDALDRVLTLFVANGITTMRGMLGRPSHLQLRRDLLEGRVFGPRLVTSGPSMNGNSVDGPEDARSKVRAQHAAGYDFIKVHPGLTAEEFRALAGTANELGMPVAGHVTAAVGLEGALEAGMATIDHLDGYMEAMMPADSDRSGGYGGFFGVLLADQALAERIGALAAATAKAGVANVPTEALIEHLVGDVAVVDLLSRPEMAYMPAATVERWAEARAQQHAERGFSPEVAARAIDIRRQLILALHQAGATLLLGSDAPQVFNVPGFSIHHELAFLVDAGLSPYEALRTGTVAVAEFLGANTGTVEVGRDADLVLLDANPFEDIHHSRRVHGVMLRGTWHASDDLASRLARFGPDAE